VPKVIITMPAYRAEGTLEKTVADIPEGVADELILVDDASPDATVERARALGLQVHVHPVNRGYGGNQKTCYTEALRSGADVVVLLHPDYQYDPKAVPLLIAPILAGDADVTFGSRFAGVSDPRAGGMPVYRFIGNRVTTTLENIMLGARFTDMHSGLRAYTRDALLKLPFLRYSDDFVFDSQMLVDAVTSGLRVVEVPIPTRYTKESSSINVGRSLRYILSSLAYCARRSLARGRRGRRSPVIDDGSRRGPSLGHGREVERLCVLCGDHRQQVVYGATASGDVPVEEFRCTTSALAQHDDIVQCKRCGHVSALPTLSGEEIIEGYENVVDEEYFVEESGRRELFGWMIEQLNGYPVRGKRLLEIGSNVGIFLDVAREGGWDVRGIEPSKWAVEQGRERFGVDIRQGTIEELHEDARSVDAIVMLDVLEHVADPLAALRTLRPMLDDEGVLVLSTVNLSGPHARARKEHWPWFIRSHLHYFSEQTLSGFLQRSGYEMVEWAIAPRAFHVSYIARRAGSSHPTLLKMASALERVGDPRVPMGWLGDITLVVARPV
jgi:2-polyprenyl-3-methyl-5-hydroxy-6-metoxy-1,4-benzoquinol methylase